MKRVKLIAVMLIILGAVVSSGCLGNWEAKKIEGKMHVVGTFNATALSLERIVGRILIKEGSSPGIHVETTLPLSYNNGSTLTLYCPEENGRNICNRYKNGLVIIKTSSLTSIGIKDSVGDIKGTADAGSIEADNVVGRFDLNLSASSLALKNIVGDIEFKGSLEDAGIENVVGRVELDLKDAGSISIKDVVGDIKITLPPSAEAYLSIKKSINLKLQTDESIYNGTKPVEIDISEVIGRVEIEK